SWGSYQPHQPASAVAGQPPLHGAERDTVIPCRVRQKDTLVKVWPGNRKTRHRLLALCLGASRQLRCTIVLLIDAAHYTYHRSRGVRKTIGERTRLCSLSQTDKTSL